MSFLSKCPTIDPAKLHQLSAGTGVYLHVVVPVAVFGKLEMYEELAARVTVRPCEGCRARCWFDPMAVIEPGNPLVFCHLCTAVVDRAYPGSVLVGDTALAWMMSRHEQGLG